MNKQDMHNAVIAYENEIMVDPLIETAARLVERLLPGECESCKGRGRIFDGGTHAEWGPCPDCSGSGQVWDEGIVEVVAKALHDHSCNDDGREHRDEARAVLSALVELLTEKVPE